MNVREKVIVDGIPYVWFTNLDDDGIREFFDLYADRIRESEPPEELPGEKSRERKVVFQIKCRLAFLNFRDGVCLWSATDEKHHVLYRSNHEWELWNARQQEIEELRQEQAAEQAIERGLLGVEDRHLAEKTNVAIKAPSHRRCISRSRGHETHFNFGFRIFSQRLLTSSPAIRVNW